jgi:mono/diheme cytochrome c family protein
MKTNAPRLAACLALLLMFSLPAGAQDAPALPEGEGKELVGAVCSQCHGLRALFVYNGDDQKWEMLVHEMVAFGAQVTPQERDTIMKYLKATFSTERTAAGPDSAQLPSGKGQEVLQASCGRCHGLSLITRKRADRTGWEEILRRHTSEERVKLSSDELEALLQYLAANLGPSAAAAKPPTKNPK